VAFKLKNDAYIALKDPEIACDMPGPSGTAIATATKTFYAACCIIPTARLTVSEVQCRTTPVGRTPELRSKEHV